MKIPVTLLSSILILSLFTNCASGQFDKKPPFTITKAQQQEWVGGKPGSKGTMVTIEFAEKIDDNIQFDSIYYNNKFVNISVDSSDEKTVISGKFNSSDVTDKMIILDKDPKKEFGNKPPSLDKKSPFELSKNECVISYTINNKKRYFKLDTLQKGKMIIYP
ncbi:hypothetical protein UMM65_05280 [Aureibaculum sp. 2210JD6-5]|uniref:hypothetical protein n=1 Tax=Aureibaculum sp. 2210JD6-5 TaxID=3103957 RepID=UPI002AADA353|nr:hypothetical protein [Aureibaculum sp. 2210JD6-5]MDY7394644.1 hypothetical protein [Aureibaculum sp. 2210JD6-5]